MKAYLAGSIFYYGDELRNREWAARIREAIPDIDLYSPIENTDINDDSDNNTENTEAAVEEPVSAKSYLAFGPYISAALIIYIVLFDIVNYLANLYIDLF